MQFKLSLTENYYHEEIPELKELGFVFTQIDNYSHQYGYGYKYRVGHSVNIEIESLEDLLKLTDILYGEIIVSRDEIEIFNGHRD